MLLLVTPGYLPSCLYCGVGWEWSTIPIYLLPGSSPRLQSLSLSGVGGLSLCCLQFFWTLPFVRLQMNISLLVKVRAQEDWSRLYYIHASAQCENKRKAMGLGSFLLSTEKLLFKAGQFHITHSLSLWTRIQNGLFKNITSKWPNSLTYFIFKKFIWKLPLIITYFKIIFFIFYTNHIFKLIKRKINKKWLIFKTTF